MTNETITMIAAIAAAVLSFISVLHGWHLI